ncbi:MAG: hypothetical protein WA667_04320, partial [Candidatus Nitrosopolaris sp.]
MSTVGRNAAIIKLCILIRLRKHERIASSAKHFKSYIQFTLLIISKLEFSTLVDAFEEMEKTSSRLALTDYLVSLLRKTP